ncbi:MAG TPA: NUDIX hydrolase [Acidimicrobiales bacterium]|nr:NUDIX hydrolase [Acidimicrobiales bacterium]
MSDSFHVEGAEVLFRSHVFAVERRTVRHEDATFTRDVALHPGAVAVLAINERGEVGFIRQYRAAFDELLLEIPAGTQDRPGESALETAKRELLEEIGYEAAEWRLLGRFMNSPGWTNQVMTIYEARDLTLRARAPAGPEERGSTVHWLSPASLRDTLRDASAIDSTTAVALHRVFGTFLDES